MTPAAGGGITDRRLCAQHLVGSPSAGPVALVGRFGAIQAQEVAGAAWGVAQRCEGVTRADIDALLDDGSLLRTHVLRPTWHLVLPEDIRWMLALTGPRLHRGSAARRLELGLDADTLSRSRRILEQCLGGGRSLLRSEVAEALVRAGVAVDPSRMVYLLFDAELGGLICSGRPRGNKQTYALLDERAGRGRDIAGEEAESELAVRYFTSHGPARLRDFNWWSGLPMGVARRGIAAAGDRLVHQRIGDDDAWSGADEATPAPTPQPLVRLLPNYDEYLVAYRERSEYYDPAHDPMLVRGGVMANIVLVEGRAAGTWSRRLRRGGIEVTVTPWIRWPEVVDRALREQAKRYAAHLGLTLV